MANISKTKVMYRLQSQAYRPKQNMPNLFVVCLYISFQAAAKCALSLWDAILFHHISTCKINQQYGSMFNVWTGYCIQMYMH